MKSLCFRSGLFALALAAACSGPKRPDESIPPPAPTPNPSAETNLDAGVVPSPPTEGSEPDVPHGANGFETDGSVRRAASSRVAQGMTDAGAPRPLRDAGAPGGVRDAGAPARDAGAPSPGDAGAPGAPVGDAGAPRPPVPGPGSAPPGPGTPPKNPSPTGPTTPSPR